METISRSIADRSPETAGALAEARIAIKQAGEAAERVGRLADSTDRMVNEEGRPLVADLRQTIKAAQSSMDTLNATLSDARPGVQALTRQTLPEVGQLVRDLRDTTAALRSITNRVDQQGAASLLAPPKLPDYEHKK